jgi:hypothetical protein
VELNVGMLFGGMTDGDADRNWDDDSLSLSFLTLGLFGKYPIAVGGATVFPMLGVQMDMNLSATYEGNDIFEDSSDLADAFNRLWVKLGIGADISLSDSVFIRPALLYGINFGSKFIRDLKSEMDDMSSFHHGLDLRLAIGFRF